MDGERGVFVTTDANSLRLVGDLVNSVVYKGITWRKTLARTRVEHGDQLSSDITGTRGIDNRDRINIPLRPYCSTAEVSAGTLVTSTSKEGRMFGSSSNCLLEVVEWTRQPNMQSQAKVAARETIGMSACLE